MGAPGTVNREQPGQAGKSGIRWAGGGKGPNHIRHQPALAKNCVRREARAE